MKSEDLGNRAAEAVANGFIARSVAAGEGLENVIAIRRG